MEKANTVSNRKICNLFFFNIYEMSNPIENLKKKIEKVIELKLLENNI